MCQNYICSMMWEFIALCLCRCQHEPAYFSPQTVIPAVKHIRIILMNLYTAKNTQGVTRNKCKSWEGVPVL